ILGVGRFERLPGGPGESPRRAEIALAVADEVQGRGIGTLLLEHLATLARALGIEEFEAEVLGENNRMLDLLSGSGFRVTRSLEAGVFHVTVPTEATEELAEATLRREMQAAAHSAAGLLCPGSVAVIGASRRAGSIGAAVLENLRNCSFQGMIY